MKTARVLALAAAALLAVVPLPGRPAPLDADDLFARMQAADPALQSYRADVEFSVGMYSFPFVKKTLHGEAFFKRPDRLEIVFSDLPSFVRKYRQLYVGLGSPAVWRKKYEVAAHETEREGETALRLVLTPRVSDQRLREVQIDLDGPSLLPRELVWLYSDGAIHTRQHIVQVDGHHVVTGQTTDIRFPGLHAFVHTTLHNVKVNAPFPDAVFTQPVE